MQWSTAVTTVLGRWRKEDQELKVIFITQWVRGHRELCETPQIAQKPSRGSSPFDEGLLPAHSKGWTWVRLACKIWTVQCQLSLDLNAASIMMSYFSQSNLSTKQRTPINSIYYQIHKISCRYMLMHSYEEGLLLGMEQNHWDEMHSLHLTLITAIIRVKYKLRATSHRVKQLE